MTISPNTLIGYCNSVRITFTSFSRPSKYLFRYKHTDLRNDLPALLLGILFIGLLFYFLEPGEMLDGLFIVIFVPILFLTLYFPALAIFNEEILWEEDGYIKKYCGPIPHFGLYSPAPADEIESFFEGKSSNSNHYSKDIKARLKNGESVTLLKSVAPGHSFQALKTLTSNFRAGELQKREDRILKQIQEQKNAGINPRLPKIGDEEEFLTQVRTIAEKLAHFEGALFQYKILAWDLEFLLKKYDSFTRSVVTKLGMDDYELLFEIYLSIANSHSEWQEFIISEIDRQFIQAYETEDEQLLPVLGAFSEIDDWKGRRTRIEIRKRYQAYLKSSDEYIREKAVLLLAELYEDNPTGTINILSDILLREESSIVKKAAKKELKAIRSFAG